MKEHRFSVSLTPQEVLGIYSGAIQKIMVMTDLGVHIELKAYHFKPFTTMGGITGRFRIVLDDSNKMVLLEKM